MVTKRFKAELLQKIQLWVIPLLLIVVAGRQIILVHTVGLSSWHGGGFGMFASIDRDERRLVKLHMTDCRGEQIIQVLTPEMTDLTEQAWKHLTTVPKTSLLRSLGRQLLDHANAPDSSFKLVHGTCLQQVQLQVCRLHYSQASEHMWYAPVTSIVEVDQ